MSDLSSKSIEDLEDKRWPQPPPRTPPSLVRCYEARKKPLSQLSRADLRLMIGQDVGLQYLIPRALDILKKDPLIETEHYRGDLLAVVLRASPDFFRGHSDLQRKVDEIVTLIPSALEALEFIEFDIASEALEEAIAEYKRGAKK